MILFNWAKKWGVPPQALRELTDFIGLGHSLATARPSTPEGVVAAEVRLEAAERGCILWRNNVGAAFDSRGNFVRYGLCNDSKALNEKYKSADLIGIKPVKITQGMVGYTIGQFFARETKRSDWKYSGNKRELAQLRFIELIISMGGNACFARGKGTF